MMWLFWCGGCSMVDVVWWFWCGCCGVVIFRFWSSWSRDAGVVNGFLITILKPLQV